MSARANGTKTGLLAALGLITVLACAPAMSAMEASLGESASAEPALKVEALAPTLQVGDLVFIRVSAKPFREVASTTGSWSNHVGIVIDTGGAQALIGESTFPFSRTTTLSAFVARSAQGRVAVMRLKAGLTAAQQEQVRAAAEARSGIFYDTGFDLHSKRQFCSRYVREVLQQATGIAVGEIETFATLLARRPETNLGFWKLWYFGNIPWERETVSPASLMQSTDVSMAYDGSTAPQ